MSDPLLLALRGTATALLADAAAALGLDDITLDPGQVRRLQGTRLIARARTVGLAPRDQVMPDPALTHAIRQEVDASGPGDALVVAVGGLISHANWGGNLALRAAVTGLAGVVTDGAVRDLDEMSPLGLGIFAQATSPRAGPRRFVPVSCGQPVNIGGQTVSPGDILVGDGDGVVALPAAQARIIVDKAHHLATAEQAVQDAVRAGGLLAEAVKRFKS